MKRRSGKATSKSNKQKLVGVVIDRNLNFYEYVFDFCKKDGRDCQIIRVLKKEKYCLNHF